MNEEYEVCGLRASNQVLTLNGAADFMRERFPYLWKLVCTKHIDAPGSHYGFKAVATAFSAILAEACMRESGAAVNNAIVVTIAAKWDFPTYYVSQALFSALQHTNPPEINWGDLPLPFDAAIYMLPVGALKEPDGSPILFVGYAKTDAKLDISLLGLHKIKVHSDAGEDRMTIFWVVGPSGLISQDCTFPASQKLLPSAELIAQKTKEYEKERGGDLPGAPPEFSAYVAGLVANFILVQSARPELVERGERTNKVLPKSGLAIHRPTFLGRKYEIKYQGAKPQHVGHYTELRWRAGHLKSQPCGKGRADRKIIWIDPYIARSASLVREVA